MSIQSKSLFIASTGQNVGKTTLSLGIFQALKNRFSSVGFFKPIGQKHVTLDDGTIVDKDAALFSSTFSLLDNPHDVSPIICDTTFTRRYLDKKIKADELAQEITTTFKSLIDKHDYVLVEGTGHMGVGSLFSLNNAKVSHLLKTPVVIIATGGIGAAFDELQLNITTCKEYGVPIKGVILNKVLTEKRSMIEHYFPKALEAWDIPLIGTIPFTPLLTEPTLKDIAQLFDVPLLSGKSEELQHIHTMKLIAGSLESFLQDFHDKQIIITPACRDDIILACIERKLREKALYDREFCTGLILTEQQAPKSDIIQKLEMANIPTLWVSACTFDVMKSVSTFTAKIQKEDDLKIHQAFDLVQQHVNFELLLS